MDKHCVYQDYTIKDVVDNLNANKDRVSIILNKNNKVVGIVSQGDIISALAAGNSMFVEVSKIMKTSFLYLKEKNLLKAYEIFKMHQITLLPIVDEDFNLLDVIGLADIYGYLEGRE